MKITLQELDLLREKRQQARVWLERLKKSFPKELRNTRKTDANPTTGSTSEKLQLSEVKLMVTEGEQLYEEKGNKELSKALNVVEAAEEVVIIFRMNRIEYITCII